jgi:hypothetical protein
LSAPIAANDAATKTYVDTRPVNTLTATLTAGNSAGTSTINMNNNKITSCADPIAIQDVATKNYVDTRPVENLAATLTAGNSAGTKKITDLVDPTLAQDAATKNFVDTSLTPYTVKALTAGSNISATNASGNWTIANTAPVTNVAAGSGISVSVASGTATISATGGGGSLGTAAYRCFVLDPNGKGNTVDGAVAFGSLNMSNLTSTFNDPSVTFAISNNTLVYTGSGTVQVTISNGNPLEYSCWIGPLPSSSPAIFTDSFSNAYYQSGIQLFCCKNNPFNYFGASAMLNQGAVSVPGKYTGHISGTTTMVNNDFIYLFGVTNTYFNTTGSSPAWNNQSFSASANTYFFQLGNMILNINAVRMN